LPQTTITRRVKGHRMVWLAEIDRTIDAAPELTEVLRAAFDRGYAKGATVVMIPESPVLARALNTIRA
jgi:hypothetical protein